MTDPKQDIDIRQLIIDWIDGITCDVHLVQEDYEYCADRILDLYITMLERLLEDTKGKAVGVPMVPAQAIKDEIERLRK